MLTRGCEQFSGFIFFWFSTSKIHQHAGPVLEEHLAPARQCQVLGNPETEQTLPSPWLLTCGVAAACERGFLAGGREALSQEQLEHAGLLI